MAQSFEIVVKFDKGAEVCEARNLSFYYVAGFMFGDKSVPGIWLKILYRKRQAPVFSIDAGNYRIDFLSFFQDFARMFDAT
jgi:hypothetical protein